MPVAARNRKAKGAALPPAARLHQRALPRGQRRAPRTVAAVDEPIVLVARVFNAKIDTLFLVPHGRPAHRRALARAVSQSLPSAAGFFITCPQHFGTKSQSSAGSPPSLIPVTTGKRNSATSNSVGFSTSNCHSLWPLGSSRPVVVDAHAVVETMCHRQHGRIRRAADVALFQRGIVQVAERRSAHCPASSA